MNILVMSAQKPDSTGSGIYLAETTRAFIDAGHDVAVIAGIDVGDEPALPAHVRFRPVRYNTPELPFAVCGMSDQMPYAATRYRDMTPEMIVRFTSAFAAAIADVRCDFEPDLVICHHLYLACAVAVEANFACPVTAVCHSTELRQMRTHGLERERIVAAVRALDGVFALHEAQKCEIEKVYGVPPERIFVVGTGYNDQVFRAVSGLRPARRVEVIFAGKIWRKKGVESLLRCLDKLSFPPDGFALRLAGGHNSESELTHMRALAAKSRYEVEFLGKLDQDALARAYNRAHVFVLPSFFEGLPLVAIEALGCGCRVVMTDLPGIREWLDAAAPGVPVNYVKPPRFIGADEPVVGDLPAFEKRLAAAIEASAHQALAAPADDHASVRHLSWGALARRMLDVVPRSRP